MKNTARLAALLLALAAPAVSAAEKSSFKYPPSFNGARTEVYKTVGDVKLTLSIFEPAVVLWPCKQKMSFCAIAMPVRGRASPLARHSSARRAASRAASP